MSKTANASGPTTAVRTNNIPRDIIDGFQLTAAERAQFDYINWTAIDLGMDSAMFVRYRGNLIDLSEFSATWGLATDGNTAPEWLDGWSGYLTDSFFSGLVIRLIDDGERAVVGSFVVAS